MKPGYTLNLFGTFLEERQLKAEITIAGAAALQLLDISVLEAPALTVRTLGRSDLIKLKVFALCERAKDLEDCVALKPTPSELAEARAWLGKMERRDPEWQEDIARSIERLERELEKQREPDLELE